jgi:hypothetical protein
MLNSNLRISNLIFKDTPDNRLYSSFISASLDEIKEYTRNYGELNLYNVHMTLVDNNKLKLEIIRTNEPNQIEITLDRGSIHPLQKQYGEAGLRLSEIIYRKAVLTVDNWGDGDSILCLPVYKAIFDIIDTETSENTGRKLEMSSGELLANIVNMSKYTSVEHNRHTEDKFKYLSGFWQFGIHKQVPVYEVHKSAKSLGKNVINGEPGSTMFNVKYTRDEENERAINKWINTIDNKLAVMGSGGTIRGNTSILTELSLDSKADGIKLPNFISIQSNSLSLSSLHKINL